MKNKYNLYDFDFISSRINRAKELAQKFLYKRGYCHEDDIPLWESVLIWSSISSVGILTDQRVRGWMEVGEVRGNVCPNRAIRRLLKANGYHKESNVQLARRFVKWDSFPFELTPVLTFGQIEWINDIMLDGKGMEIEY